MEVSGKDGSAVDTEQADTFELDLPPDADSRHTHSMRRNCTVHTLKRSSRSGSREQMGSKHTPRAESMSPVRQKRAGSISHSSSTSLPFSSSPFSSSTRIHRSNHAFFNPNQSIEAVEAATGVATDGYGTGYGTDRMRLDMQYPDSWGGHSSHVAPVTAPATQQAVKGQGRSHSFDLSFNLVDMAYRAPAPRPSCITLSPCFSLAL